MSKSKYTITQAELEEDRAQRASQRSASSGEHNNPIWLAQDSVRIAVQFMVDPLDEDASVRYREINVSRLRNVHGTWSDQSPWPGTPRDAVPFALASVPVVDYTFSSGKLKYTNTDMVKVNGKELNLLSDIADPGDRDFDITDEGNCLASWRTVVDVVVHFWEDSKTKRGKDRKHPQPGDHILLKMRDSDWKGIQSALRTRADEEGEDLLKNVWVIKLTPGKMGGVRRVQSVAKYPQPILDLADVSEFDVDEKLDEVKQAFVDYVTAAESDMYVASGSEDITEGLATSPEEHDEDPMPSIDYDMLPVVRLKEILEKAGVPIPSRPSRVTLLKLVNALPKQAEPVPDEIPF